VETYWRFFQVADDPETLRIKQNTKNISNVAYHGDIQKKAAMERQREITEIVDNRGKELLKVEFAALVGLNVFLLSFFGSFL
jgi:hypothetical protein